MKRINILFTICNIFGVVIGEELSFYKNDVTFFDRRYSLGNLNDISQIDRNTLPQVHKPFNIRSITSLIEDDVNTPKFIGNESISDFLGIDAENVSPECLDIIQTKTSCVFSVNNEFDQFCEKLNNKNCQALNVEQSKALIQSKCGNVIGNMSDIEDYIKKLNSLIESKKFFCYKNTNSTDYCPITKSLQKAYLKLVKEVEKSKGKQKRNPTIHDFNSFFQTTGIQVFTTRRKLVDDLIKNCNDTLCNKMVVEYIHNIRNEFSYFNLIYKYDVNDDALKKDLIKTLVNVGHCSSAISKYIIPRNIIITISIIILFLF